MTASPSPLAGTTAPRVRLAMLGLWIALVLWLATHHVFWRDEVRALNFALSGDDLFGMFSEIHGDSHPALWFLMLRLAYSIVPTVQVLPLVALVVGMGVAAIFALRAPFGPIVIATALFSAWMAYEFTVMARDYGIAALLILAIAWRFASGSRDGPTQGLLIALLCNTNVPAIPIAGGFILFWLIEIVTSDDRRPAKSEWTHWSIAASLCLVGVIACFLVVYPTFNDAAVRPIAWPLPAGKLLLVLTNISTPMATLLPATFWSIPAMPIVLTVLLLAGPVSLLRSPAAFIASLVVLVVLTTFFQLVYAGSYRHTAEYLVFLLSLHWMVAAGCGGRWPRRATMPSGPVPEIAGAFFVALLVLQTTTLGLIAVWTASGHVASRARDFGALLARERLNDAVVIADADTTVEALRYYAPNPTWLVRERRWSRIPHFTRRAILDLTLDDLLTDAVRLHQATRRPIAIAVSVRLSPRTGTQRTVGDYGYSFTATPDQTARFLAATRRLARFGPAGSDESYDVYLLNAPLTGS